MQPGGWWALSQGTIIAAGLAAAVLLALLLLWRWLRPPSSPEERERKRRLAVNGAGRISDGNIVDYRDGVLCYSYSIAGVDYTASQDVSSLGELLPGDPSAVIGPASVKFLPRNPANSIVVCEHWSGLRARPRPQGA